MLLGCRTATIPNPSLGCSSFQEFHPLPFFSLCLPTVQIPSLLMLLGYFPEPWDILFQSNNGVNNTQGFYQYLEFGYFEDGSKTLPDFHTRNLLFFQYLEVSAWNSWIAMLYPQNPINSVPGPKMGEIPPQQLVGTILEFVRLSRLEMRRGKLKSTQSLIEVPNILVPSETKFSGFLLDSRSKGNADL